MDKSYEQTRKSAYKKEYRKITIRTADGSTLCGMVNIGMHDRVSDLLTKGDSQFIVMTDVAHKDSAGKVLFVNKHHIVWAEPED